MKKDVYTDIWDYAADHYGVITTQEAAVLGVPKQHLVTMYNRGALTRLGHGVYRVKHHVFGQNDVYAHAVAQVGPSGYLRGASVLAMFQLCPTNPNLVYVGTPVRCRRRLPKGVVLADRKTCDCVEYKGIRSEPVVQALRTAWDEGMVERTRIAEAAQRACEKGLLTNEEAAKFKE